MPAYRIGNTFSGLTFGIYEGTTEAEALDAMARDAGYANYAVCCEVAPAREGEIVVTQIDVAAITLLKQLAQEAAKYEGSSDGEWLGEFWSGATLNGRHEILGGIDYSEFEAAVRAARASA